MRYFTFLRAALITLSCLAAWEPVGAAEILFYVDGVAGNAPTRAGDIVIRDRLIALGHNVTTVNDSAGTITDVIGKSLIIISSSIQSGDLATFATTSLRTLALPILDYESALYDELLMGASGTNPTGLSTLNITLPAHALAAALTGAPAVYTGANVMSVGVTGTLGTDATIVATIASGEPAIFTYGTGNRLSDNTTIAAARRIGFYLNEPAATAFTADGLKLFDSAVNYALVPEPGSAFIMAAAFLCVAGSRRSRNWRV